MQFKYYKRESIIYDRMQLPRVVFIKPDSETSSTYGVSEEDIKDFTNRDHIAFVEGMQSKLVPYETSIRQFYADEFMSDFDFFQLLIKSVPFFGFETLETYLGYMETFDEATLKTMLIRSLIRADREIQDQDDESLLNETEALVGNRGQEIAFIKNLPTEEHYRFNLLMMLEDPLGHLKEFKTLMQTLTPLYDEAYEDHREGIQACELMLERSLEAKGEAGFDELTQGFINKGLLEPGVNRYLISLVFPYSFMIISDKKGTFIVSGIHMDEGFDNLLNKHVSHIDQQTKLFKNFADKTRYEVLRKIASGTTSTKQIAEDLGVSSATISYHINAFVTTNILKPSPDRHKKYDINFEKLKEAYQALLKDLGGQ